ncbi:DUF6252 family protein [Flavobacterium columnare]|uniref:Uncharacterized protein n=1 Tax=Flavobacterium columnare TaxID=996 RepID=A0AAI8GBA5_9FLAO|nr:DUF6252 family protein [Flavobacterium columnare]AMO20760.1 hypothetical protein UN65_10815 [Flavobacterium columnare]AUX18743.1 hypothetical protein AQ623_10970 [Flavobacterium columnare]QOG57827.1 hypothetical protein HUE29_10875 [Flavobacterium columnare]QOG60551.1 hypothetical protein HUE30_10875 [Flavobacterium columnare]QOG63270.1 hypothetical protein HUE31_10875 [Flavobacterium columnare]
MRNSTCLFLLSLFGISCQDDVTFNNQAFQVTIENSLWKANSKSAKINVSGVLTLEGSSSTHSLKIQVNNSQVGTYSLGTASQNALVVYSGINQNAQSFSTGIGKGPVSETEIITRGTGYLTGKIVSVSGGSGTGLKVNIDVDPKGLISEVTLANPGKDYKVGDLVTVNGGNNDAELKIISTTNSGGQIVITENTGTTISGTFTFTAFNSGSGIVIGGREGVFYKIPISR